MVNQNPNSITFLREDRNFFNLAKTMINERIVGHKFTKMINGNDVNIEFTEVNGIAGDVIIFILN
jgi:hypothetical protein